MSRLRPATLVLLIVVVLLVTVQPTGITSAATTPRYEQSECMFRPPSSYKVECGWLYVPENRQTSNSETIRLHVAVFKARSNTPKPDPIIFLDGGPGGYSLATVNISFVSYFARYGSTRDFIMFDQRGVGYSEPSLDCREVDMMYYDSIGTNPTPQEQADAEAKALIKCRTRLERQGVDLSAYNSAENAADVHDLRVALGYDAWNLYGISYGTRLALTVMRDYPDGIRSVVLDSTYPLQVNLYEDLPSNANRVLTQLFDSCAKEKRCNATYPKLEKTLFDAVAKLNKKPVKTKISLPDYSSKKVEVTITGDAIVNVLFELFYSTKSIPTLPQLIYEIKQGNYNRIGEMIYEASGGGGGYSTGMYYSVQCAEEVDFLTFDMLQNANSDYLRLGNRFDMSGYYNKCKGWGVPKAPDVENKPVSSDIPTLIMAGQFDPITPPSYGKLAGETLDNSYFFEFPGVGHGASVAGSCPRSIMTSFITTPDVKPSDSCIAKMSAPKFVTR